MKHFGGFVLFFNLLIGICGDDSLDVTIKQGKLRGFKLKSRNGTDYRGFLGIPYAKPPLGELRFRSPQEPDSWTGIRDATIPPSICVQKDIFYKSASVASVLGDEDCLYLNVFSPFNVNYRSNLPVMVYIHGGGFVMGSGSKYSPDYFLDYDVIVVFFNYRLGPLGFLSTADSVIPGNYGMKDQVAALKWVRQNIATFGGDPQKVTIFGESAGGASVDFHMYSPLSKGLFQRAISQSGSALSFWSRSKPTLIRQKTIAFGIIAGCLVESTTALLKCLRNIPAKELMFIHHKFYTWDFEPTIHFAIVPEPEIVEDAFIHEDSLKVNPVNIVPWMTGLTSGEGAIKAARFLSGDGRLVKEFNDDYKRRIPLLLNFITWVEFEDISRITGAVKRFYFEDKEINMETAKNLVDMITDGIFLYPCLNAVSAYTSSAYLYYYDHKNLITFSDYFGNCSLDLGVCHVDDLISLFHMPAYGIKVTNGTDLNVSTRMVKYWINFAQTGNPSTADKVWHPFDANKTNYLHITSVEDNMRDGLLVDRFSFWKNLFFKTSYKDTGRKFLKDEF